MQRLGIGILYVVIVLACAMPAAANSHVEQTNTSLLAATNAEVPGSIDRGNAAQGAVSGSVLAFVDYEDTAVVELALELLGVEYEVFRDDEEFSTALEQGGWDLVIAELPLKRHDYEALTSWVENGGKLIASMWAPSSELLAAMETELVGDVLSTALPFYSWDTSGTLFSVSEDVPLAVEASVKRWRENGYRLSPQGEAIALAGFAEHEEEHQAAIVLGREGRTLMNGFLFSDYVGTDEDADSVDDVVELLANEAAVLLGATSSSGAVVERSIEPGVPVEGCVPTRGFEWVDDTLSGYLEYSIAVPGAWAFSIHLQGKGNLDLYVRAGSPVRIEETSDNQWIVEHTVASVSADGEEHLLIAEPQQGVRYWIAVENKGNEPADYTLSADAAPVVEDLPIDSVQGTISEASVPLFARRNLSTSRGLLSIRQYRFTMPASGETLSIRVEGPGSWYAHLRKDFPVTGSSEGATSDLSIQFTDVGELSLAGILPPGEYYLALEALSAPQSYVITVTRE